MQFEKGEKFTVKNSIFNSIYTVESVAKKGVFCRVKDKQAIQYVSASSLRRYLREGKVKKSH